MKSFRREWNWQRAKRGGVKNVQVGDMSEIVTDGGVAEKSRCIMWREIRPYTTQCTRRVVKARTRTSYLLEQTEKH